MLFISVTFDMSSPERLMFLSDSQPLNIQATLVTLAVLNADRSTEPRFLQPENMLLISVTLEVSMPARLTDFKFLQLVNIPRMLVTFDMSSCDKSTL